MSQHLMRWETAPDGERELTFAHAQRGHDRVRVEAPLIERAVPRSEEQELVREDQLLGHSRTTLVCPVCDRTFRVHPPTRCPLCNTRLVPGHGR